MNKLIKKNKKQRLLFKQIEFSKIILNSITSNFLINRQTRLKIKQLHFSFNLNGTISRINNRCILTGRSKSINRFFKLSRIQLRVLASNSMLPGVSKYNW